MSAWNRLWVVDIPEEELDREVNTSWLRRVKAEGDRLEQEGLEHHSIAVEYYEKLEAIKTWLKTAKAQGRISISDGMKLDEIMERIEPGLLLMRAKALENSVRTHVAKTEFANANPMWQVWYINPDDGKEYYMMVQAEDEEAARASFKRTRWKGTVEPTRIQRMGR